MAKMNRKGDRGSLFRMKKTSGFSIYQNGEPYSSDTKVYPFQPFVSKTHLFESV